MPKAENEKIVATPDQRKVASDLTEAKRHAKEWTEWGNKKKEELRASLDDRTDITLVTEKGIEVASVTESEPKTTYDMKRFFEDHPAQKLILEEKYANEPKTVVTVLCSYEEPDAPTQ